MIVLAVSLAPSQSEADSPERCKVGNVMSALNAFYPGIFNVNEFGFDTNGQTIWIDVKGGGLGHGVAHCQFRLFAAAVPYLPNSYEFCANDVFLGGNLISFPYKRPDEQAFLDAFYSHVKGSYRKKAIADMSLFSEEVTLTRETYLDSAGIERPVGDGGDADPALTDPMAGDPKVQELVVTSYRDSFNGFGDKVVTRHEGFIGQLDAGKYWVALRQFYGPFPLPSLPPVEVNIVQCD
jgi:hypothetical protein